jgi:hypothetical protein
MKKIRSVRVSDQLWRKAQAKARKEGKSLSEASQKQEVQIVDFLKEYVK